MRFDMSVLKTKNGNWFVNYYLPDEWKKGNRKYSGHGRESELAARFIARTSS